MFVGKHTDPKTKKEEKIYIKTILCGSEAKKLSNESKPLLIFLHGFGGSGALYYKLFDHLMKHFVLITIDMVGMGGSSRPMNFDKKTLDPVAALGYYVEYIE